MKRRLVATMLLVVATATFLFIGLRMREPVVNGQPVSYWIEPRRYHPGETWASVGAAFGEMDQRSVRWLARELDWQPSRFRQAAAKRVNVVIDDLISEETPGDRRIWAATALGNLGERAMPAVAALKGAARTTVEPHAWNVRSAAKAALIRLGQEPLQSHVDALRDTSNAAKWYEEIDAVEWLGTNAVPAVPIVASVVLSTNAVPLRVRAVGFLGAMRSSPEISVPALRHSLDEPRTRGAALIALGRYGVAARNATDAVAACLTDTNRLIQMEAMKTLRAINPEKAHALDGDFTR